MNLIISKLEANLYLNSLCLNKCNKYLYKKNEGILYSFKIIHVRTLICFYAFIFLPLLQDLKSLKSEAFSKQDSILSIFFIFLLTTFLNSMFRYFVDFFRQD